MKYRPRTTKGELPADDPPAAGTRFFARVHAVDLACPRCDKVHAVAAQHRYLGGGVWDPLTSTFQCDVCGLTLQLAVLAYPVGYGRRKPAMDSYPISVAEALKLRRQADGVLKHGRKPKGAALNAVAPSCSCRVELYVERAPDCPVHAPGKEEGRRGRRGKTSKPK